MVELYYLCVDIRNYRAAVHLRGVSLLLNNYSKNLRLLPLSPAPSNNVAFHQVGGLTLKCTENSEELLHYRHNIHLREKSSNVLLFRGLYTIVRVVETILGLAK